MILMTEFDLFFEFIIVIIELAAFMIVLIIGAVILEVIVTRIITFLKLLTTRLKIPTPSQHKNPRSEHSS